MRSTEECKEIYNAILKLEGTFSMDDSFYITSESIEIFKNTLNPTNDPYLESELDDLLYFIEKDEYIDYKKCPKEFLINLIKHF